ncbi:hypothetical protein MASR2M74_33380 [Paracoccaceae bacterium]
MDILYKALIWCHLLGIALGGAASFGHPVLGAIADSTPEARPFVLRAGKALGALGRAGIVALVGSGVLMIWLAYDIRAMPAVFWVKMVLVVALVVNVVMAGLAAKAVAEGNTAAGARLPVHGVIGVALMLLLLAFGILSFR